MEMRILNFSSIRRFLASLPRRAHCPSQADRFRALACRLELLAAQCQSVVWTGERASGRARETDSAPRLSRCLSAPGAPRAVAVGGGSAERDPP
jgi:hypothetical protein